jgi:hypothetical protein
MPFAWSKRVVRVIPITTTEAEVTQIVVLPTLYDKISPIEHKNGEQVASARKEDDEDNEVKGNVQEGRRPQEGDLGGQEDLEEARRR